MNEPTRWQAIALIACVVLTALSPLCIVGESLFTTWEQRPSRWSSASLLMLVGALVCLTVAISPFFPALWRTAFG